MADSYIGILLMLLVVFACAFCDRMGFGGVVEGFSDTAITVTWSLMGVVVLCVVVAVYVMKSMWSKVNPDTADWRAGTVGAAEAAAAKAAAEAAAV